jgi:hypothetical protein
VKNVGQELENAIIIVIAINVLVLNAVNVIFVVHVFTVLV